MSRNPFTIFVNEYMEDYLSYILTIVFGKYLYTACMHACRARPTLEYSIAI